VGIVDDHHMVEVVFTGQLGEEHPEFGEWSVPSAAEDERGKKKDGCGETFRVHLS